MNTPVLDFQQAAAVFEALAAGHTPDRADILNAALVLSTYCQCTNADRDLLNAAHGLELIGTGRTLDLDATGRQRATKLAQIVRHLVP